MNKIWKRYKYWYIGIILIILCMMAYGLYTYNIYTIRNIFMQGLVFNVDSSYKLKSTDMLVNLKFHVSEDKLKKKESYFKFYNKNRMEILEVKIYKNKNNDYHYAINDKFLYNKRKIDSFMKMFCFEYTNQCGITFAFSKNEVIYQLPEEISFVTLDNIPIGFTTVLFDYENKIIGAEIAKEINNIQYEYNKNHVKVCTKFDTFKYTEALRISTINMKNEVVQKVCTKEEIDGECCELNEDMEQFKGISVLHWKGSWNEGFFKEYSIELKK